MHMRKCIPVLLLSLVWVFGCEEKKPEVKYNPDRVEHEKHPQPTPSEVPQAGVEALKDIKNIKKNEGEKVQKDQQLLEQADE